mgnify:CR=1 FL=1
MQVTQTLNDGLKRGYEITVPATELEAKVTEKLEEARKDFQMKGFRKGKAPAALMKKMFGKSVLGEAMQESIDDAMRRHFEATGDRPALQPEVKVANEDWKEGDDVQVTMVYEALPAVPELALDGIALERLVAAIDESAVEEALGNRALFLRYTAVTIAAVLLVVLAMAAADWPLAAVLATVAGLYVLSFTDLEWRGLIGWGLLLLGLAFHIVRFGLKPPSDPDRRR